MVTEVFTRSATVQRGLLERAARHPMVREEALKNLGYHYLQVGEQTNDVQTMVHGFNLLWQHFLREPHTDDLSALLQWAQRFQQVEILKELVSYLKPENHQPAFPPKQPVKILMLAAAIAA